jgi:hypothetical protein
MFILRKYCLGLGLSGYLEDFTGARVSTSSLITLYLFDLHFIKKEN